jgi:hypothetical protein
MIAAELNLSHKQVYQHVWDTQRARQRSIKAEKMDNLQENMRKSQKDPSTGVEPRQSLKQNRAAKKQTKLGLKNAAHTQRL